MFLSFGAGIVAGGVALRGMEETFTPMHMAIGGGALAMLVVANVLATRRIGDDEDEGRQLPGEKYADREEPQPHEVVDSELEGVPFDASKKVTSQANGSKREQKLRKQLDKVNKELQRANVRLGLGEISEEGYSKIVERLKKKRAQIEDKLNQRK